MAEILISFEEVIVKHTISLLLLSPPVLVAVFMMVSSFSEPSLAPCTPAPATFATWVVCNTATARALVLTATPRVVAQTQTPQATQTPAPTIRTQTPAPAVTQTPIPSPTRITGTEAPGCWVVGQGVRFKFSPCSFGVTQVP